MTFLITEQIGVRVMLETRLGGTWFTSLPGYGYLD